MKKALLYAGLLLAVCGPAYAGNNSGQINARLTILPSCGVELQDDQYQMQCNVASVPQPRITESRIPSERITTSAAVTANNVEIHLITVEW
ncbi:hypothetical protein B4923_18440 [Brenneria roseae subsp. americana]|uniref:DUF2574 domain-containing protein n=1 Tax=Brenneria roseae subsp. americana TaxID=1508507 RepID=A0A2U1TKC1_9GAMM|nr:hypothetical protein [Brenneria roseae]PWC09863.1 hypothetical protein B4923_18440 [Brenneria roseae subsp. americana]